MDAAFETIAGMRAALRARTVAPVEIVESVLSRIASDEPHVHAWREIDGERALAAARALRPDDLEKLPLAGIPFGVKDVIDVRGLPTRFGVAFEATPAAFDAWCVAAVRRAGAIPIGKTQTTPFAMSDPAPTRNPWDLAKTPGGSSSGSGATVGARQVPFAFGTQTGGSTLRPAAYCGAVGFKPTHGAIPTPGVSILSPTCDHAGIIARDVADAVAVFSIFDPTIVAAQAPHHPNLIDATDYLPGISGSEIRAGLAGTLERFRAGGMHVVPRSLPAEIAEIQALWDTIVAWEGDAGIGMQIRALASPPPQVAELVAKGAAMDLTVYAAARDARARIIAILDSFFEGADAIVLPAAGPAPLPASTGNAQYLRPWTFAGFPSISIPAGLQADGMPYSVQLVARKGGDATLLALALACERANGFENPGPRARLDARFATP